MANGYGTQNITISSPDYEKYTTKGCRSADDEDLLVRYISKLEENPELTYDYFMGDMINGYNRSNDTDCGLKNSMYNIAMLMPEVIDKCGTSAYSSRLYCLLSNAYIMVREKLTRMLYKCMYRCGELYPISENCSRPEINYDAYDYIENDIYGGQNFPNETGCICALKCTQGKYHCNSLIPPIKDQCEEHLCNWRVSSHGFPSQSEISDENRKHTKFLRSFTYVSSSDKIIRGKYDPKQCNPYYLGECRERDDLKDKYDENEEILLELPPVN
jgi:hypothetical protein